MHVLSRFDGCSTPLSLSMGATAAAAAAAAALGDALAAPAAAAAPSPAARTPRTDNSRGKQQRTMLVCKRHITEHERTPLDNGNQTHASALNTCLLAQLRIANQTRVVLGCMKLLRLQNGTAPTVASCLSTFEILLPTRQHLCMYVRCRSMGAARRCRLRWVQQQRQQQQQQQLQSETRWPRQQQLHWRALQSRRTSNV